MVYPRLRPYVSISTYIFHNHTVHSRSGETKLRFPTPSKGKLPPLPSHAPKVAEVAGLADGSGSDADDDGAGMAGIADHILEKIKGRAKTALVCLCRYR